jgi:hypothetical protein
MILTGKPKDSKKNISQCHFVNHKSDMDSLGANPGLDGEKPATNRLNYVTAWCSG